MLKLQFDTTRSRNLFFGDRIVSFCAKFEPEADSQPPIPVAPLASSILRILGDTIPSADSDGKQTELLNLRGRPAETFSRGDLQPPRASEEELLFLHGTIRESEDSDDNPGPLQEDSSENPIHPFHFQIKTKFTRFQKGGNIVYETLSSSSSALRERAGAADAQSVLRLSNATIETARLGFEVFRPRFLGSIFGTAPKIEGRLYLDLHFDRIRVEGHIVLPPTVDGVLDRTLEALSRALEEQRLFQNFAGQVRSAYSN